MTRGNIPFSLLVGIGNLVVSTFHGQGFIGQDSKLVAVGGKWADAVGINCLS